MSLSELQRRNLIVKFCLEKPNKSKSETVEHFKFKLMGFKSPTIYRTIKRFEKQEKVERKNWFREKCSLSSSKVRAALKKQTAGRSSKSYREMGRMIKVYHNTVKKYLIKIGVHCKAKNPHLKLQHVNNLSSKLG
jgi:hypothetical protein